MISKELNVEMDAMQNQLRTMLNDDSIVLREEATIAKLLDKFKFTVDFMPKKDMVHLADELWTERKETGIVMVPSDAEAGREFMRQRNVAIMALWKLRKQNAGI